MPGCCPPFLQLPNEAAYRAYFEGKYCAAPLNDSFGLPVRFRKSDFAHCCYESSNRDGNKDTFSVERSKRLDWIEATLQDASAVHYQGWDKKKGRYDPDYRVTNVYGSFVVVVRTIRKGGKAVRCEFRTCYYADNSISKIRKSPPWFP